MMVTLPLQLNLWLCNAHIPYADIMRCTGPRPCSLAQSGRIVRGSQIYSDIVGHSRRWPEIVGISWLQGERLCKPPPNIIKRFIIFFFALLYFSLTFLRVQNG
jgi:hypothetical protein